MASIIITILVIFALVLVLASARAGIIAGRQVEKFALPFDWRAAARAAFEEACALLAFAVIGVFLLAVIGWAGFMLFVIFGWLL